MRLQKNKNVKKKLCLKFTIKKNSIFSVKKKDFNRVKRNKLFVINVFFENIKKFPNELDSILESCFNRITIRELCGKQRTLECNYYTNLLFNVVYVIIFEVINFYLNIIIFYEVTALSYNTKIDNIACKHSLDKYLWTFENHFIMPKKCFRNYWIFPFQDNKWFLKKIYNKEKINDSITDIDGEDFEEHVKNESCEKMEHSQEKCKNLNVTIETNICSKQTEEEKQTERNGNRMNTTFLKRKGIQNGSKTLKDEVVIVQAVVTPPENSTVRNPRRDNQNQDSSVATRVKSKPADKNTSQTKSEVRDVGTMANKVIEKNHTPTSAVRGDAKESTPRKSAKGPDAPLGAKPVPKDTKKPVTPTKNSKQTKTPTESQKEPTTPTKRAKDAPLGAMPVPKDTNKPVTPTKKSKQAKTPSESLKGLTTPTKGAKKPDAPLGAKPVPKISKKPETPTRNTKQTKPPTKRPTPKRLTPPIKSARRPNAPLGANLETKLSIRAQYPSQLNKGQKNFETSNRESRSILKTKSDSDKQKKRKVMFTDAKTQKREFINPDFLAEYEPELVKKALGHQIQLLRDDGFYTDSDFDEVDDEIYEIALSIGMKKKKGSSSTSELSEEEVDQMRGTPQKALMKDLWGAFKRQQTKRKSPIEVTKSTPKVARQSKVSLSGVIQDVKAAKPLNLPSKYNVTAEDVETILLRDFSTQRVSMSEDRCFRLFKKRERGLQVKMPNNFYTAQEFIYESGMDPEGPLLTDHIIMAKFDMCVDVASVYVNELSQHRACLLMHLAINAPLSAQGFLRQLAEAVVNRRLNSTDLINGFLNKIHDMATGSVQSVYTRELARADTDNFRLISRLKNKIFSEFYRKVGFWELKNGKTEMPEEHIRLLKSIPKLYKTGYFPFIDFISEYIANNMIVTVNEFEVALNRFLACSDGHITRNEFIQWCVFNRRKRTNKHNYDQQRKEYDDSSFSSMGSANSWK